MRKVKFHLIYCGRNDNYSDQDERIPLFIEYYSKMESKKFDLEMIVVDWNTDTDTKKPLIEAFDWTKIKHHSLVFNKAEHEKIDPRNTRCILDYVGRNRGLTFSKKIDATAYSVIVNQDVFIRKELFELVATQKQNDFGKYFYRADRTDIVWTSNTTGDEINNYKVVQIHKRLIEFPATYLFSNKSNRLHLLERSNEPFIEQKFKSSNIIYKLIDVIGYIYLGLRRSKKYYPAVMCGVHGNASGDFLIIPNPAIESGSCYPETINFYMHTDSYILFQLLYKGLRQRIIELPEYVLHVDHPRKDRREPIEYNRHLKNYGDILNGKEI